MRRFLGFLGAAAVLVAGCSGGGGFSALAPGASGGSGIPSGPGAPPAPPTATPSPTPNPHPIVDGAVVTYALDSTTFETVPSAPPTLVASSSGIFTLTAHSGATFKGHSVADLRFASPDGTNGGDNYEGYVPTSSGQNFGLFGTTRFDTKVPYMETYDAPDLLIYDQLPEVSGGRWINSLASNYTLSRGPASKHLEETTTQLADGSFSTTYVHTGDPAATYTETHVTKSDGSATVDHREGTNSFTYAFGVPVLKNGTYVVPITYTDKNGTQVFNVPDWYPGHALPVLGSDVTTNLGIVATPKPECAKAPQIQSVHLQRVTIGLSVIGGELRTDTEDYYFAPSRGLLCDVVVTTRLYYDNLGTGALYDTIVDTNAEALTSSGIGFLSGARRTAATGVPLGLPVGMRSLRHVSAPAVRPASVRRVPESR